MTYTFVQASDLIHTIFSQEWTSTGLKLFYQNVEDDRDTTRDAFASIDIVHGVGFQATLGGVGRRSFRRSGVVTIRIYTQAGKGLQESRELAKVAVDAFEGRSIEGIWFRNVRMIEIGREGSFFQTNVLAEFEYDEVK